MIKSSGALPGFFILRAELTGYQSGLFWSFNRVSVLCLIIMINALIDAYYCEKPVSMI